MVAKRGGLGVAIDPDWIEEALEVDMSFKFVPVSAAKEGEIAGPDVVHIAPVESGIARVEISVAGISIPVEVVVDIAAAEAEIEVAEASVVAGGESVAAGIEAAELAKGFLEGPEAEGLDPEVAFRGVALAADGGALEEEGMAGKSFESLGVVREG